MRVIHNHSLALYLATNYGFPVFPARETAFEYTDRKTGKLRTRNAKSPYTEHGLKEATTAVAHINAWWTKHPDALVGVVCGERSGILAVDIDSGGNKCGEASFAATGLTIPQTVQTRTMSG